MEHPIFRQFTGEADLFQMIALSRRFPEGNLHVTDLPYRLSSWAVDDPENTALWLDDAGHLQAWAILQTPFWTIDYAIHPAKEKDLHPQILVWAEQRARQSQGTPSGRPTWFVNVFSNQMQRIRDLEKAGFTCQANVGENSWSKVFLKRPASAPIPANPLSSAFTMRPLAGEDDVEAYVELHQSVFESKNMTSAWRRRILHHPAYRPDLDLVAVDERDRLAAFCIAWLNPPAGQIEPLGVHADFRNSGLGRALLSENLRRLQYYGAKNIFVETDNYRNAALALYESTGFRIFQDVLVFRKDYA